MNAKERVHAILNQKPHDRLGWNFLDQEHNDILFAPHAPFVRLEAESMTSWGHYPELLARIPHFHGEVCMDIFGNIIGRLEGKTKGECVRGALQDGWDGLDNYHFPVFDKEAYIKKLMAENYANSEKYVIGSCVAIFSVLRDIRLFSNALMDTLMEPESVEEFLKRLFDFTIPYLDTLAAYGVDGIMIADDWGTQIAPFINPLTFKELFQPAYMRLANACHARGLDFIVHSCGYVYPLVEMFVEAGVNAFQFDQPELSGSKVWAEEFGSRVAFYCPVDIQKILSTGDRALIEKTALDMCNVFRENGGNLICKDYPSYWDIGINLEWAKWAEDVIVRNSDM